MTRDLEALAEFICVCTGNHDPAQRIECAYAKSAAQRVVEAGWEPVDHDCGHRLDLLRAVESYDRMNQSDLPLGLLDSIRAEVQR